MAVADKTKNSSWKTRFRFLVINDVTFEEVFRFRLSKLEAFFAFSAIILIIITGVSSLIAFTNLREFIPGYPDGNMRWDIVMNAYRLDSLENEIRQRDRYFEVLRAIISGEEPDSISTTGDSVVRMNEILFTTSAEDSLLRQQIEREEKYSLSVTETRRTSSDISGMFLFPPVRGLVINPFNAQQNHFGTDIVAGPNEIVKSILDGTVIAANWTVETGNVIQIQHPNDLISIYKHNRELLKTIGSIVKAGEAVAIIGNSGELTTGPHLHFELWFRGTPLDPEDYIVF